MGGGANRQFAMQCFASMMRAASARVRITLPSGELFGPKGCPVLSSSDLLIVFTRESSADQIHSLPPNWVRRDSRSQPGKVFFENTRDRRTTWKIPDPGPE